MHGPEDGVQSEQEDSESAILIDDTTIVVCDLSRADALVD